MRTLEQACGILSSQQHFIGPDKIAHHDAIFLLTESTAEATKGTSNADVDVVLQRLCKQFFSLLGALSIGGTETDQGSSIGDPSEVIRLGNGHRK